MKGNYHGVQIAEPCRAGRARVVVGISESLTPTLLSADLAEEKGRERARGLRNRVSVGRRTPAISKVSESRSDAMPLVTLFGESYFFFLGEISCKLGWWRRPILVFP